MVDEHGGTSGIVTLQDVIEELIGEVQDEFVRGLSGTGRRRYFLGRRQVRLDYLRETVGLNLPAELPPTGGRVFEQAKASPGGDE